MSLDVYLECPDCHGCDEHHAPSLWHANITHNLGPMAREAGLYEHLWRPDEIGVTVAAQLVEPLIAGIRSLVADPERYRKLNPPNGWGSYEKLGDFCCRYLLACDTHPTARVRVSR